MNYHLMQLVADLEDRVEEWVDEIEQIQEDVPESEKVFFKIEEMKSQLKCILEISEEIRVMQE